MADEIEQIRRAEVRRGKRPIDVDTVEERRRMAAALKEILNYGTEEDLRAAMREFGLSEDRPEWTEALRIWNAEREQN